MQIRSAPAILTGFALLTAGCSQTKPALNIQQAILERDGSITMTLPADQAADLHVVPENIITRDGVTYKREDDHLREELGKMLNWPIPEGARIEAFGHSYWKQK